MPNINLIAARREEKKKIEVLTRQLFMGLLGSGTVLMFVIILVSGQQLAARQALAQAEKDWASVKPDLARIEDLHKQSDALIPKVKTLQQAKLETSRWQAIMQAVAQAMPQDSWLSNMQTVGSGADMTLNLAGLTSSQTMVGETMTRLNQQTTVFDAVELRITNKQSLPGTNEPDRFTFDFGVHLKPAPQPSATTTGSEGDATQKADAGAVNGGNKNG